MRQVAKRAALVSGIVLLLFVVRAAHTLWIFPPTPDPGIAPSEFRTNPQYQHSELFCELGHLVDCLAYHLMYLQCGAILVEKLALSEDEDPAWHAYSMHSGPKVLFLRAAYYLPEFFDPSLPAKPRSGEEFDPLRMVDYPGDFEYFHPRLEHPLNVRFARFVQATIDWLDSQDKTIVDACELQSFWKQLRAESFPPMEESGRSEDE